MKKLMLASLLGLSAFTLAACGAEIPEGIDDKFHRQALSSFIEIDEDTMEMELSDQDDILNVKQLTRSANSDREKVFVEGIQIMIDNQKGAVRGEDKALTEYDKGRTLAMQAGNMDDEGGDMNKFSVPEFQFGEG